MMIIINTKVQLCSTTYGRRYHLLKVDGSSLRTEDDREVEEAVTDLLKVLNR